MARPSAAEVTLTPAGIQLQDTDLFLDARRPRPLSFVSHAHMDHVAMHAQVIATPTTAALIRHRLRRRIPALTAPFGHVFDRGPLQLSLHPSGHVRGAAQLLIRRGGRRILYTGDLAMTPGLTAEPTEVVPCDLLVMEATFGHPRFRFPARLEALKQVEAFARDTLEGGATPVFLAYALGKAQELIAHLATAGLPVRAEASIRACAEAYRATGSTLPVPEPFTGTVEPGEVLVIPPHPKRGLTLRGVGQRRTAVLTGWAADGSALRRFQADEAIALSDHADFEGLLTYARATGAKRVYTVHGFCEPLAEALRARGIAAQPLSAETQLNLFD